MNYQNSLFQFLNMYYTDTNIPCYLYEKDSLYLCFPKQEPLTYPPIEYVKTLYHSSGNVAFLSTDYGVYFGGIHIQNLPDFYLVLGPVCAIPYSDTEKHALFKDYVVPMNQRELFFHFLNCTPQISQGAFITKLFFLNYCFNQEELTIETYFPQIRENFANESHFTQIYDTKETLQHNKSYEFEEIIMEHIRTGNYKGIKQFSLNIDTANIGIIAPTALRQLKNTIIITTALSTRAAIDGGLDTDTAYQLSDNYIQHVERINDPNELYSLFSTISYEFSKKVYDSHLPITSNDILQKAIRFIQENTNQCISVTDVAAHVGFSRSYFSTYFKKELGFSVNDFILRCRLEEGKYLLQYTAKPLSVISNYLCFSSQSHFQTAFKKKYGMTPLQYRKNGQKS